MCALSLEEPSRETLQEFKDRQAQLQREHSNESLSGRVPIDSIHDIPKEQLATELSKPHSIRFEQDDPSAIPITSHEAPPWEYGSELDANDEIEDEYPEGEGVDIQPHHLPGIQAIVGDQFTLHSSSIFPRNRAEIDQAAAMFQSSEFPGDPRETQARTGFTGGRVSPQSAEESRRQTVTQVFNNRESSTFRETEKKRRRLNNRNPRSGKDFRIDDQ